MANERKDALTDVAQSIKPMSSGGSDKPAGTVVSADGTRVTLGEQNRNTAALSSPKTGMNLTTKGK